MYIYITSKIQTTLKTIFWYGEGDRDGDKYKVRYKDRPTYGYID